MRTAHQWIICLKPVRSEGWDCASNRCQSDSVHLHNSRQLGTNRLGPSMRRPVDVKAHFCFLLFFSPVPIQLSRPCRHPSIRTLCERYSLGARWVFSFSRCCYLIIDLGSVSSRGVGPQDLVAVTWTRRSSSAVRIET